MSRLFVFNAKDFLDEVEKISKFWLKPKHNKLRIETHKNNQTAEFISINKKTGLETGVSIPALVHKNLVIYCRTASEFHYTVWFIRFYNTYPDDSLRIAISKSPKHKNSTLLEVAFPGMPIDGKVKYLD